MVEYGSFTCEKYMHMHMYVCKHMHMRMHMLDTGLIHVSHSPVYKIYTTH